MVSDKQILKMSKKSVLLDTFWKLSDGKENARVEAAAKILTTLTSKTKVWRIFLFLLLQARGRP